MASKNNIEKKKSVSMEHITALMVVYNEEKLIARCLYSIKDVADKILVVHDGKCDDNTIKICKRYGAKVFTRPHVGECDPHWPFLFGKVKSGWILKIDADECLSPELKKKIRTLVEDKSVNGYKFKWDFYNYRDRSKYQPKMALFRKDSLLKFRGVPHEIIRIKGNVVNSELELVHKPALSSYTLRSFRKKIRWTEIHAEYLKDELGLANAFIRFLVLPYAMFLYNAAQHRSFRVGFFVMLYYIVMYYYIILFKLGIKKAIKPK